MSKNYKNTKIGAHALKPESLMMSYGYAPQWSQGAVKPPIFLTSTFAYETPEDGEEFFHIMAGRKERPNSDDLGGLIYSRFNHPNVEIVEDRLALLEGSESCVVFSSGMGAISGVLLGYLRPGDVIMHSAPLYGGTETLIQGMLPDFDIQWVSFNDGLDEDGMRKAAEEGMSKGNLKMIFVETPANPTNAIVDFEALNKIADEVQAKTGHRPITACDNTMLGPIHQRVVPQGIDLGIYSLTKYVGGHSDLVAGAVTGSEAHLKPVRQRRSAVGLNLDPHTSWMISRSLETLTIRMERASETAFKIAQWLKGNSHAPVKLYHPQFMDDERYTKVAKRQMNGAGSTFSFVIDADKATAFKLINALQLFKSAVSLGGTESLVCHPASTTHSGVSLEAREISGVTDGLIRLSIGLEHPDDLIADLDQAFQVAFE